MRPRNAMFLVLAGVLFLSLPLEAQSRRRAVIRKDPRPVVVMDDFRLGALGWTAGFADYSTASAPVMELDSGIRPLPAELGVTGTGFFITGHNRSDDLFMFLSKKLTAVDGILPNQRYDVSFRLTLASNAGTGCAGIGGAPGESVYLKVGATGNEPRVVLDETSHYSVTVDKGQQSQGGSEASVAGNVANGTSICSSDAPFVSILRQHRHPTPVMSNAFGELWLVVGTDSGFEGKSTFHYQSIDATLTP